MSAGAGASTPARAYASLLLRNDDATWPEARGLDLVTQGPCLPIAINLARSGATSGEVLQALTRWRASLTGPASARRAAVVITAGGNDLKNALFAGAMSGPSTTSPTAATGALEVTLRNLTALVARLRDPELFAGGCDIFLATVYDPSDGREVVATPYGELRLPGFSATVRAWRDAFVELAARLEVIPVDAHALFAGHGYVRAPTGRAGASASRQESWFADPIHPNDRGHHELRLAFLRAMGRLTAAPAALPRSGAVAGER